MVRTPQTKEPEFLVAWEPRASALWANLRELLRPARGHAALPPQLRLVRAAWFTPHFPWRGLLTSVVLHVLLVFVPLPNFGSKPQPPAKASPQYELTWVGPSDALPPVEPLGPEKEKKLPGPAVKPEEPPPPPVEEILHARQRIISMPKRPNNSLLTLQQPDLPASQEVMPKPLPNIILWARTPLPPVPRLELAVRKIEAPKLPMPLPKPAELPANLAPNIALVNIAPALVHSIEPELVVPPSRTAPPALPGNATEAPAVNLPAGEGSADRLQRLIALSASPAPLAPVIEVPRANFAAQFSIGPNAGHPASPTGGANGRAGAAGGASGGVGSEGAGANGESAIHAADLYVSREPGTPPGMTAGASGPSGGMTLPEPPSSARRPPQPPSERREMESRGSPIARASLPPAGIVRPETMKPPAGIEESILSGKKVYTLSINMPNLASRSGSWVLRFSELEEKSEPVAGNGDSSELTAPVARVKIDPKYTADAVREHVEGEIVLYAIIRKDGKVEGVQVLKGLDRRLDENAIAAFQRWEFVPAKRAGIPVDLEAVVHIPFRLKELF